MKFLVILTLLIICCSLNGIALTDISEAYNSGDLEQLSYLIENFTPISKEDRAGSYYYKAKISNDSSELLSILNELADSYDKTEYGQLGMLELVKIYKLERKYNKAITLLQNISPNIISEKNYLLALLYLNSCNYSNAIKSAQNYIKGNINPEEKELAYLLIADAYIQDEEYALALSVLDTIISNDYAVTLTPLVYYQKAYSLEMTDSKDEAIAEYKNVITNFPYSEQAFRSERRLYNLTITQPGSVDYSQFSSMPTIGTATAVADVVTTPVLNSPREHGSIVAEGTIYIQVNAFEAEQRAKEHSNYLAGLNFTNRIIKKEVLGKELYAVAVGPFSERNDALKVQKEILEKLNLKSFIIID